jgi:hypothetical protein
MDVLRAIVLMFLLPLTKGPQQLLFCISSNRLICYPV